MELLIHGDCMIELSKLPDNSVDLVCTNPPYAMTACSWDTPFDLDAWWRELLRVAKPDANFVMFACQPFTTALIQSRLDHFKYELIWEKQQGTNPMACRRRPLRSHENIIVFSRGRAPYNPQMEAGKPYSAFSKDKGGTMGEVYGGRVGFHRANPTGKRYPKSVLRFNTERKRVHPTQKPLPLLPWLIRSYSNADGVVLDPFAGSGTTAVAAKMHGCRFIAIEREAKYGKIIRARLATAPASRRCPDGAEGATLNSAVAGGGSGRSAGRLGRAGVARAPVALDSFDP